MEIKEIESFISKIPDYPKPGILFYDISTLISNNYAFSSAIKKLIEIIKNYDFDLVASIDARGFLFGSVIIPPSPVVKCLIACVLYTQIFP